MLTSKHCAPARGKTEYAVESLRRNRRDPVVHAAFDGVRRDELRQRGAQEALEDEHQDEAIDNCRDQLRTPVSDGGNLTRAWTTGVDGGDQP